MELQMTRPPANEKRRRAAAYHARPGPTPDVGQLRVRWASPFDRSCFLVSTPDLAIRHRRPYDALMHDLRATTGCTEAEILAHGSRVRSRLLIAQDQLARSGALANLGGRQKHEYDLAPVPPAF
jgi:hypothetical protein